MHNHKSQPLAECGYDLCILSTILLWSSNRSSPHACKWHSLNGGSGLSVPSALVGTSGPCAVLHCPDLRKEHKFMGSYLPATFSSYLSPKNAASFWLSSKSDTGAIISTTTSNMQERPSANSGNSLPEYNAFDGNGPPAYPLEDLSESPARPKEAHRRLPHDETRAGASTPPLAEDYVHMQNGLNFDVEANMAAANVRPCSV